MDPTVIYDAPYVTIRWESAARYVHVEWNGFVHGDMGREALNKGLAFVKARGVLRWLADMRKLKVLGDMEIRWVSEDWFPRAAAAGVRFMALVIPESALAQMSIRRMMSQMKEGEITTAYFSSVEEAGVWLRETHQTL